MKDPYQRKSTCFHMGFLVLLQTESFLLNIYIYKYNLTQRCSRLLLSDQRAGGWDWESKAHGLSALCRRLALVCQVRCALLCYPHKGARVAKHRNKTSPTRESSRDFPTAVAEFINKFTQL